eukprot:2521813-Pleurochrysis_carterae.AAC.1
MSSTSASADELRSARAEQKDVAVLSKGSVICVLPRSCLLEDRRCPVGDHLPFWVGNVLEDDEAPVDAYGKRLQPIDPEDTSKFSGLASLTRTAVSPTA